MPNYCHNRLRVRGANEELQRLVAAVADPDSTDGNNQFSYQQILPVGEGEDRSERWGSTSIYCLEIASSPDEVIYEFESGWDPPLEVIDVLAFRWPELAFEYVYAEPLTLRYGARSYSDGEQRYWTEAGMSGWGDARLSEKANAWMRAFLEQAWPQLAAKWWPADAEAGA